MLSFFRINDPYRLIIVLVILFIAKIPFFFGEYPITEPELKWLLIGEKLSQGHLLYAEIWDTTAPLSALVYWGIYQLFGFSYKAMAVIAMLVVFVQSGMFNVILLRQRAYNENVYLPALIYAFFSFIFFDLITLSPQLMGLTFIIPAYFYLFSHMEISKKRDQNLINIGIFIGVASLFYMPYLIYLPAVILGLLFFTNTITRRYLLMIYCTVFPFIVLWMVFYFKGETQYLTSFYFGSLLDFDYKKYMDYNDVAYIMGIPFFITFISVIKTFREPGFINYQVRIQSLFFLFLLFLTASWLLWSEKTGATLIIFVPCMAFFFSHYILLLRKKAWIELVFFGLLVFYVGINFYFFNKEMPIKDYFNMDTVLVSEKQKIESLKDRRILVIGDDYSYYQNAKLGGAFLNWRVSKEHLTNLDQYEDVVIVDNKLSQDKPEVIVDLEGVMPKLIDRIPWVREEYLRRGMTNLYFRHPSN